MYVEYPYPSVQFLKNVNKPVEACREALQSRVQAVVDETGAPFLEVAGPTVDGFIALNGI